MIKQLELLKSEIEWEHSLEYQVVLDEVIKTLGKQIPKEPINKTKPDNGVATRYENCNVVMCPACNGRLKMKSKGKYCDKCGQKLDWR